VIWITKRYAPISDGGGGTLFQIGDPIEVYWYTEGRPATRAEILAAIDKGLPFLRKAASDEGPEAIHELEGYIKRAMPLVPA
jgi:hypothetical protein